MRKKSSFFQTACGIGALATALAIIIARGLFLKKVIAREATEDDLPAAA